MATTKLASCARAAVAALNRANTKVAYDANAGSETLANHGAQVGAALGGLSTLYKQVNKGSGALKTLGYSALGSGFWGLVGGGLGGLVPRSQIPTSWRYFNSDDVQKYRP